MKINEKIKELREEKNLSQYKISSLLEIQRYTYANWEQGRSEPSSEQLIKLADFFNVSIDYLVGREDDYVKPQVESTLSYREQKLLRAFSQLDDDEKDKIIEDCEYFANKHTKVNQQQKRA